MGRAQIGAVAAGYTAAWNSGSAGAVAAVFAQGAEGIILNGGTLWAGRGGVQAMAAGFFAEVPDLALTCDGVRMAGGPVLYLGTFTGHHAETRRPLQVLGWEEWEMDRALPVAKSRG